MTFTTISALSPLDGRYASKLNLLRPLTSELGYMHRRVQVEGAWFVDDLWIYFCFPNIV